MGDGTTCNSRLNNGLTVILEAINEQQTHHFTTDQRLPSFPHHPLALSAVVSDQFLRHQQFSKAAALWPSILHPADSEICSCSLFSAIGSLCSNGQLDEAHWA